MSSGELIEHDEDNVFKADEDTEIEFVVVPYQKAGELSAINKPGFMGFNFNGVDGVQYATMAKTHSIHGVNLIRTREEFGQLLIEMGEIFVNG